MGNVQVAEAHHVVVRRARLQARRIAGMRVLRLCGCALLARPCFFQLNLGRLAAAEGVQRLGRHVHVAGVGHEDPGVGLEHRHRVERAKL